MKIDTSKWKVNAAIGRRMAPFWRRRRGSSGDKAKPVNDVVPVNPVAAVKPTGIDEEQIKGTDVAALEKETSIIIKDAAQTTETEPPVKVVIPASALIEDSDEQVNPKEEIAEPSSESVSEEVADSLLVKVNQENNEKVEDVSPLNNVLSQTQDSKQEPAAKAAGSEGNGLLSSLFEQATKKEETPLDILIKSLPDITMEELLGQAEETKRLIKEWW